MLNIKKIRPADIAKTIGELTPKYLFIIKIKNNLLLKQLKISNRH